MKAIILGVLISLAVTPAARATVREVALAGIVIRYDDQSFVVDEDSAFAGPWALAGDGGVSVVFRCADVRQCYGDPMLVARAGPVSDNEDPSANGHLVADWGYDSRPLWTASDDLFVKPDPAVRDFGGLLVSGTVTFSGCRARTPPMIRASAVHDGVRYRFSTGHAMGCGGIEGFSVEEVEELLSGITLVSPQAAP
jgi:hypothetical protein